MAAIATALHALAAVVWVGGMFFAYVVLRPSVSGMAPPDRLGLWRRVFERFFPWVIGAVVVLLVTGYGLVFGAFGGFRDVGFHVHLMQLTGWAMFLLFFQLYFAPWRRYRTAVDGGSLDRARGELDTIRRIVAINLGLGLVTVAVGASGRWWG